MLAIELESWLLKQPESAMSWVCVHAWNIKVLQAWILSNALSALVLFPDPWWIVFWTVLMISTWSQLELSLSTQNTFACGFVSKLSVSLCYKIQCWVFLWNLLLKATFCFSANKLNLFTFINFYTDCFILSLWSCIMCYSLFYNIDKVLSESPAAY